MPIIKAGTTTILDKDVTYDEVLAIDGELIFDPTKNITLTMNNKNIVVTGKFTRKPNKGIIHRIVFAGINENNFIGGGESVLESDTGLWVTGSGQLDWEGQNKTAHTNAFGGLQTGQTKFGVNDNEGWEVGDEIAITPTMKGDYLTEERKIIEVGKSAIGNPYVIIDKPLTNNHPTVVLDNGRLAFPEVANLTRNCRIEGTATGKTHVFIMSMMMQNIMYCGLRYMGPRKNTVGDAPKEPVKGRYGIHFHHCMDSNVGMCMEGNVVRDTDNHAFVTHMSNGICWCDNIGYNLKEIAFWYDVGDSSHGIEYDHNLVVNVGWVDGSYTIEDPTTKSFGTGAFLLGKGDGNSFHDNVIVGVAGKIGVDGSGGVIWMNDNESTWDVHDNLIHNCSNAAINNWQNTAMNHTLRSFTIYYCGLAAHHGAYANDYRFVDCVFVESCLFINAGSLTSLRVRVENCTLIGAGFGYGDYATVQAGIIQVGSPVDTIGDKQPPNLYRNLKFINMNGKPEIALLGGENAHDADIVDCNITNLVTKGAEDARVQQNGKAYSQNVNGKKDIPLFAPGNFGDGNGVLVEYFSDTNFKNKVAEIVQPQANFTEWSKLGGPHHLCPGNNYSVRVTGFWVPQYTDLYSTSWAMDAGGQVSLFINSVDTTKQFQVIGGKKYPFEIRFQSLGNIPAGFAWNAKCPSMKAWYDGYETVPQSQLYTPDTVVAPPPVNKPPIANAGPDQTITLPQNSVTLNGSGSDPDGNVIACKWTNAISGPVSLGPNSIPVIANPDSPSTLVTGFQEGSYLFRLTVTDDKGATAFDDVQVAVKPAPINQPPQITISQTNTVLTDVVLKAAVTDPDSKVTAYQWTQVSGPTVTLNGANTATCSFKQGPKGNYSFTLTVTYDNQPQTITPYNFSL